MDNILELMRLHKVEDAYLQLVPLLDTDSTAQDLFLQLMRAGKNLFLLEDYVEVFKEKAETGNPYFMYAYARYHDMVQPLPDSNAIMEEYYRMADHAGIADAHMCLAYCWRDGDFGLVDRERYMHMRQEAVERGSHTAAQQQLRDMINGEYGYDRDPWKAYDMLDKLVRASEEKGSLLDPRYIHILGEAAEAKGNNAEADLLYEKALNAGDTTAWYWLMRLRCYDEDGQFANEDEFMALHDIASELAVWDAYAPVQAYFSTVWDDENEELKEEIYSALSESLELGYDLGDGAAAVLMGLNYYSGDFGYEQDYAEAWKWFARAALRRTNMGYTMMARMIENGEAPKNYNEEFQHICELRAYRLGDSDMLEKVITAYKRGFLTDFAVEIEKYYLPEYESTCSGEDEYEDDFDEGDDGRYDAYA